jgi:hypothetical protein
MERGGARDVPRPTGGQATILLRLDLYQESSQKKREKRAARATRNPFVVRSKVF